VKHASAPSDFIPKYEKGRTIRSEGNAVNSAVAAIPTIVCLVSYVWIGLFILQSNPRSTVNRLFALLCAIFSLWSFGAAGLAINAGTPSRSLWERVNYFGSGLYIVVAFLLLMALSGNLPRLRARPLVFAVLLLPIAAIQTANLGWNLVTPRKGPTAWYYAHFAVAYSIGFIALAFVWRWGRRTRLRRERLQARWIVWTTLASFAIGLAMDFTFDARGYTSQGNIMPLFWLIGICYAIRKYGFLRITAANATRYLMEGIEELAFVIDPEFGVAELNAAAFRIFGKPPASGLLPVSGLFADHEGIREKLAGIAAAGASRMESGVLALTESGTALLRAVFFLVRDRWEDPIGYFVIAREWRRVADFARRYSLSEREEQVLRFILAGLSQRKIADNLFLSLATVKSHTTSLYNKLGVNSRNEVWAMCIEE
jgi:DNA-binding CsgD family transcriptional regulator